MVLWRISRHQHLASTGGLRTPGHWHHQGHPVVYLGDNPASALLEVCVHTSANYIPPGLTLLKIIGPHLPPGIIAADRLPEDWMAKLEITRDLGTQWLRQNNTLLLEVPSALVPETKNYLFNPLHSDAGKFAVESEFTYPFDVRLKG